MVKKLNRLTAKQVKELSARGNHADGGGLYLQVTRAQTKSWLFRFSRNGRAREMGLGSVSTVSLIEARARARECRMQLAAGEDPIEVRKARNMAAQAVASAESNSTTATHANGMAPPAIVSANAAHAHLSALDVGERSTPFYYRDDDGQFVPSDVVPGPEMFIEGHITTPWLEVNVRRLSSDHPLDTVFRSGLCCLSTDLSGSHWPNYHAAWERAGAATAFVRAGPCNFIPAGQTVRFRSDSMRYRKVTCLFDAARFDAFRDWEWGDAELSLCLDLKQTAIRNGLLLLAREALEPGFGSEVMAESMVTSMMVELSRAFRKVTAAHVKPEPKLAAWQLQLIRDKVESTCGPSPSMTSLAAACAVSPRHLARLFRNTTGVTISAFIADARIRQAKALLVRPDLMIKAIAYECGFQTPAAFTAAFRKVTGRSPRQYRLDVFSTWA